jgi:hypothetical protein
MKYVIEDTTLTAIGDAVRAKNGSNDLIKVSELADTIINLPSGGGGGDIPEEALVITGDCQYRFANNGWNWFIENYGDRITTKDIGAMNYMFNSANKLTNIPFDINCKLGTNIDLKNMFSSCYILKELPKINNAKPSDLAGVFQYCNNIREIPDDLCDTWDWSYMDNLTSGFSGNSSYLFYKCYSLRKYPNSFLSHGNPVVYYGYSVYFNLFYSCCSLDEIADLPFPHYKASWASNSFYDTFTLCYRLKNMTFALQEDGTPYVMNWKNQVVDLSQYVGYTSSASNISDILKYNSGITADKQVIDDTTYQALKNDVDWFTADINYSRYNHDSAVRTLASLPDTSTYGTNTIKFKGASGSLTDGGAINTLTEEEIAVATAKGWTVSLS